MKKKVMKKGFSIISLITIFTCLFAVSVMADNISIDGNFDDWDSVKKTKISSLFYKEVAFIQEGDTLYMYAKENATNTWEKYFSNTFPVLISENGEEHTLVITEESSSGNKSDLVVRNQNGYSIISGSSGKRKKDGTYVYELKIPVKKWGNIDSVKIHTDYSQTQTISVKSSSSQETTKAVTTQAATTKPAATTVVPTTKQQTTPKPTQGESATPKDIVVPASEGVVVIDGHFDEWKNYPFVYVTNWNMPENQRNDDNCRRLSIVVDDDYIYFYVRMIGGWNDPLNGNEYMLSVGQYGVSLNLRMQDDSQLPQYNLANGRYDLNVYYKNKSAHLSDETLIDDAEAKMLVSKDEPDQVEVKVPKEIFKVIHGIDVNDVKEITLSNPNLFDHGISSSATSTAPAVGIIICIISAGAAFLIFRKKKSAAK